ncbi:CRP-like cAMP-binding protein [Neolewinella xylanilytica]|uniref:CRP-like cAMP-binding protein n=1 Tax=Neolewinella xylanilytica TaxID=1514080 RepID=A0A2S6I350_9BACT|nr:Crp/Fnr family transcriptional regulator [Neolewinella xylanilytica]PPK85606.1 CRP-like cAMP-binding protein [Neolewinella xylanilytica]
MRKETRLTAQQIGISVAPPEELEGICQGRRYGGGEYIYRPGDHHTSIFFIRAGTVKIGGYGPEGSEVVYDIAGPGDFFGNLKYLGNRGGFQEFVRALTRLDLAIIDLTAFKQLIATEPAVHEWFAQLMVRRWSRTEARLFRIAALSPLDRLRHLLGEVGDTGGNQPELLTQSDLASLTGLTRQTVAKLLRQL